MNKRKEPQKIAASKGSRSDIKSLGFDYYITILMTVTTIIACCSSSLRNHLHIILNIHDGRCKR